jgi:3-oxoadipate enol-lactonase
MTPLHGHDLVRPDAVIRYWTVGRVEAPTVVLLHGATLDHRAWIPQIDALQDRFHVVVPDLRGHGVSTGQFDFGAAVDDALALLDELPVERVVLVGLSLGGNIAQELIRREPDRVGGLVAADTTCNSAARHSLAASAGVAALRLHAMIAGNGFARQSARAIATSPQAQRYALEVNAHRSNQDTVQILASLLSSAARPEPGCRLPVPALLVHGAQDRVGDIAAEMQAWSQREPLARYAVIPDAGHLSNLDNPAAFTAAITMFLHELVHSDPIATTSGAAGRGKKLHRHS